MTFCPQRDFVIEERFDKYKLDVVDYKSLSITKYDRLVFSRIDDFLLPITSIITIFCRRLG